jgi:superfamily II DNA or RNA helicase
MRKKMREITAIIRGLSCTLPSNVLESDLTARTEVKKRIDGKFKDVISYDPLYINNRNGTITCGLGALLFLARNNPFISFSFSSIEPDRRSLTEIRTPEGVTSSPKWKVNGRERFYFHEALEACRKNYSGTIKLPTGSGKTPIELTLAHNQVRDIGTGIMLVPTTTIRDQFERSAEQFGIELRDYREWLYDLEYDKHSIIISLPMVLYNDLTSQDLEDPLIKAKLDSINWIIADECHHSSCKTWNTIFLGLRNLTRSHGFSAQPIEFACQSAINFAGMSIEDAMTISVAGPVIYQKTSKELKDFINIPRLINFSYNWPKGSMRKGIPDWRDIVDLVKGNEERLMLIANIIKSLINKDYNTIVHVTEKALGLRLLQLVDSHRCACWFGGEETFTNSGLKLSVDELRKEAGNSILGVICTSHALEGMDLDTPLNAIVLIDGKKPRQVLQKCGRITRPDKRQSVIVNLMDFGVQVLPRHSDTRRQVILQEFGGLDVLNTKSLDRLNNILEENHETDKEPIQGELAFTIP